MSIRFLSAYLRYRLRARHHNGHGIHSPFMYEFARNVFFAKKTVGEPRDKQEGIKNRINTFCQNHQLQPVQVASESDLNTFKENCVAYLDFPYKNSKLWQLMENHKNTKVSACTWRYGITFAVPYLQKQKYVIKL